MKVKIKRLFHGYASVRDYQAKEAYTHGENLEIICENKYMVVPNDEIMTGSINQIKFQSKHEEGLSYYLIDYPWEPEVIQEKLL